MFFVYFVQFAFLSVQLGNSLVFFKFFLGLFFQKEGNNSNSCQQMGKAVKCGLYHVV